MDKRFIICAAVIAVLVLLGLAANAFLEPYHRMARVPPTREAAVNNYLALERWLIQTGHPVRVEKRGGPAMIASGPEQAALVQASACRWENAGAVLRPWIEAGNSLVISLEYSFYDEGLADFLVSLGISADNFPFEDGETEDAEDTTEPADEEILNAEAGGGEKPPPPAGEKTAAGNRSPDFDPRITFFADEAAGVFTIRDSGGVIRLARVSLGKGSLALIGRPWFMYNNNLNRELNARLAWELTAAKTGAENPGLLFIRDRRVTRGLFGKLADRGNTAPLALSALALIVLGFWMVIPVFGLTSNEKPAAARPIRERFLAEVRFLKKYGALGYYLEIYQRELKLEKEERPPAYRDILRLLRKMEDRKSVV
jgi:uncharacterized protein YodC (DUF2158 family)